MVDLTKRKNVDLLVEQFWKHGYLTIKRKFGTYLPEPAKVGDFDVDIIARYKKNYAIGITLTEEDLNDPAVKEKINFLATRQTKFTNKKVLLFIGVPEEHLKNAKALIDLLNQDVKRNIRLFPIVERKYESKRSKQKDKILFS